MRRFVLTLLFAVAPTAAGPAWAAIATSLSSYEGREEPTVLYHPSSGAFSNDSYTNITDQGGGVVRYTLRYRPDQDWWDGDRSTSNTDRQRAEVKGLGAHQKTNQTFRYTFDWQTDPNFIASGGFCHIFQLKSTDGDSAPPLVTLSLNTNGNGTLRIWSGTSDNSSTARSFQWTPNTWSHADIIITTSQGNTGSVIASINGDRFTGVTNAPVFRPDATDYRPKWGLYRAIRSNLFVGANWVEQREVTSNLVPASDLIWNPSSASGAAWNTTDATTWIRSGVPGAFANGNKTIFSNARVGEVAVAPGGVSPGAVEVSNKTGTYTFIGGPIQGSGALTKTGGGTLNLANANSFTGGTTVSAGVLAVNGSLAGSLSVASGAVLQGNGFVDGTVTLAAGGALAPGNSTGSLSVGSLVLGNGAILDIEIGGTRSGTQHDRLDVVGLASIAGSLEVSLVGGFQPEMGNSFDIFDWGTLSGAFRNIALPALQGYLAWDISQLHTEGILAVTSAMPGDYNQDGVVDASDFTMWRDTLGLSVAPGSGADGDSDGLVTAADYDIWKTNFGQSIHASGSGANINSTFTAAAVPEPSTLVLVLLAAIMSGTRRRR